MPSVVKERLPRVGEAWIVDRTPRRVAVVRTVGPPRQAARRAIPALYRAVYSLKVARKRQGRDFKVEPLRARWLNVVERPRAEWIALWALPVPDDVVELPAQEVPIEIEQWEYGTTAEILYDGAYRGEAETVERLLAFAASLGYEVAGAHEEEYLTRPGEAPARTIIRYQVRRRRTSAADG